MPHLHGLAASGAGGAEGSMQAGFGSRAAYGVAAAAAVGFAAAIGAGAGRAEADTTAVVKGALRTKVALELLREPQTMTGAAGVPNPVYWNTLDRDVIVTLVYGDAAGFGVNGTGGGPLLVSLAVTDLAGANGTPAASNDGQGASGASIMVPARRKLVATSNLAFSWTLASAKLVGDGY